MLDQPIAFASAQWWAVYSSQEPFLVSMAGVGIANADPQPEPVLVPPVSPPSISSPLGPRVLVDHSRAGIIRHRRTEGAGIYSLMRNMGSSLMRNMGSAIGISVTGALLAMNTQINHAIIAGEVIKFNRGPQTGAASRLWNPDPYRAPRCSIRR
jgi:hypothetical protein